MKVYILFEVGYGDNYDDAIVGVTKNKTFAELWTQRNIDNRDFKEVELDKVPCSECGCLENTNK